MIYYLIEQHTWLDQSHETYVAAPGPEGFVHCCDHHQIPLVRAGWFPAETRVVALALDPTSLSAETRYQPGSRGEAQRFPHVFGPIARSAVEKVIPL